MAGGRGKNTRMSGVVNRNRSSEGVRALSTKDKGRADMVYGGALRARVEDQSCCHAWDEHTHWVEGPVGRSTTCDPAGTNLTLSSSEWRADPWGYGLTAGKHLIRSRRFMVISQDMDCTQLQKSPCWWLPKHGASPNQLLAESSQKGGSLMLLKRSEVERSASVWVRDGFPGMTKLKNIKRYCWTRERTYCTSLCRQQGGSGTFW